MTSAGWQGEGLGIFTSDCCVGALLVLALFLNSEIVEGAVAELWTAEKVVAGDETATVVDIKDEVVV